MQQNQRMSAAEDNGAEATFTDLIGATPAAVTIVLDGHLVYANTAAETVLAIAAGTAMSIGALGLGASVATATGDQVCQPLSSGKIDTTGDPQAARRRDLVCRSVSSR